MTHARRRRARLIGVAAFVGVAFPGVAHADAAGPTDYRTEIESIDPASDAVEVSIVGGDSFVAIDVSPGHRVVVLGYDDEPYLLVDEAGLVFENQRSFATYYNEDRYGSDDIPDIVDVDARPDWRRIGEGGTWAWHDHRAHWMGRTPPVGLDPGDTLPAQVVPIEVDGTFTSVTVRTTLLDQPSIWPAAFGIVIGLAIGLAAWLAGPATVNLVAMLVSALAFWVGLAQYRSLPPATGPLLTWWLLPALALACTVAVIAVYGRSRLIEQALTALAGLLLVVWAFRRWSGLTSAVLPTELPYWFDRSLTTIAAAAGVAVLVSALRTMFSAPHPAGA